MLLAIANAAARKGGTVARLTLKAMENARELAAEGGDVTEWFNYEIQCLTRFDLVTDDERAFFLAQGIPE